jgi:hypothetical protein
MRLLKIIPDDTKIDFVGVRYFAFAIDGLLLIAAIWAIAYTASISASTLRAACSSKRSSARRR